MGITDVDITVIKVITDITVVKDIGTCSRLHALEISSLSSYLGPVLPPPPRPAWMCLTRASLIPIFCQHSFLFPAHTPILKSRKGLSPLLLLPFTKGLGEILSPFFFPLHEVTKGGWDFLSFAARDSWCRSSPQLSSYA